MSYIQKFPNIDSPEIIGLHPNADLTFRFKEVNQLLDTIVETQPKQSSGSAGGKTRGYNCNNLLYCNYYYHYYC